MCVYVSWILLEASREPFSTFESRVETHTYVYLYIADRCVNLCVLVYRFGLELAVLFPSLSPSPSPPPNTLFDYPENEILIP